MAEDKDTVDMTDPKVESSVFFPNDALVKLDAQFYKIHDFMSKEHHGSFDMDSSVLWEDVAAAAAPVYKLESKVLAKSYADNKDEIVKLMVARLKRNKSMGFLAPEAWIHWQTEVTMSVLLLWAQRLPAST
jgi:hypothetical protein